MSEYHVYECDKCGHTQTVFCDGRKAPGRPSGWQDRADDLDYCSQECEDDAT